MAGLMLLCGLRAGEVLGLDVVDVDIGGRWLKVTGKGAKQRRVPLDVDVAGLIPTTPSICWPKGPTPRGACPESMSRVAWNLGDDPW